MVCLGGSDALEYLFLLPLYWFHMEDDRSIFHVHRAVHMCLLLSAMSVFYHSLDLVDNLFKGIARSAPFIMSSQKSVSACSRLSCVGCWWRCVEFVVEGWPCCFGRVILFV